MSDNNSNFKIMLQAMLDKAKSIINIKSDIKKIEPKLPKVKVQATLDSAKTRSELNAKLKSIRPKVKVDADTTQAVKKIKKLGQKKIKPTVQPTVDGSQVVSGLKEAQKQTKTLWDRFVSGAIGVNLIRMSVQKVTQAIYQAIVGIKELDKIKTDIQTASGVDDSRINSMMQSYNQMAKDLSSTTKDVGNAANEIVRMGESLSDTNKLIENSTMLSKIGMIESSQATEYLISSMKGFQISAQDSMKIIDKLTSVDMKAAVSAGGLAEAMSRCANIANNSGTSMDRLIGYMATVGEVTQDSMSVIGNSFKSMYSRMNNIKIGKFVDDETGESLSDTERVLNKLGIQLRDTQNTYRDFDDVLDDVGNNWRNFTQVEQNAISVAIAGTMQRERFIALMNNYSNALKYSEVAANSAGSALERYGVYQDSIEAKTNELTAAIESLSMNTVSEELYSGIIQATTGLVEFLDKTNLLKGALSGLVAMGVSKAFVSISTGIISAVKSTTQLSAAMALFDKGRSKQNLLAIGAACKGLSNQQLRLVLSTKHLIDEDRKMILAGMGVSKAERQQTLATLGFANAENAATAATFSFKGAFTALRTVIATNPLGAIFTAVTTLTMLFSLVKQKQDETRQKAIELTNAYKEQKDSLDAQIEKYKELKETLDNGNLSTNETRSIKEQLLEIQKSLIESYGNEASNIDLVNGKYKEQLGLLSELSKEKATDYVAENRDVFEDAKKELEKIRTYTINGIVNWNTLAPKTEDQQALLDFIESYSELFDITADGSSNYASGQFDVRNLVIKADVDSADELMRHFYDDLDQFGKDNNIDVSGILEGVSGQLKKTTADEFKEYKTIYDEFMKAEIVRNDTLRPLYQQSIQAVEDYNNALSSGEGVAEAKANLDSVQQSVQNAAGELEGSREVFDGIYDGVNKSAESAYNLTQAFKNNESVKGYAEQLRGLTDLDLQAINFDDNVQSPGEEAFGALIDILGLSEDEVQNLIDKLVEFGFVQGKVQDSIQNNELPLSTITSSIEQIATQLEPQFKKLGDAYKEIFTADGFTLDAVDNSMLEDLRKTFTEIEEEIGVTFDTTQLENFFAVLSNSNSTAKQTQEAFDNIATSYLYSTDVLESLNSTTVDSIAKQLESLGITNASQLATEALAAKEEYLAFARREHTDEAGNLVSVTQDLANATADDINVLIAEQGALEGEGIALDETTQKMIAYWMQKQAANGQLSTVGDIQQLSALCEGLGVSSKALRNYIYFKKLASMTDVYDAASIERFSANAEKNMEQAQADIQSIYDKLGGAEINFAVPDTSKKSKSEKDTTKEFDWIEQAIENVEKEVKALDDVVNSAYSTFSQKNEALAKEIGKVNEEIELQQQAYDEYMRKADSIGLSEDYKTLIHDGAINIENISDEKLQKKISEYQQWYEKAVDASDAISELSTKVKDLHVAGYELQTDRLEELLDNEAITEKQYLSEMKKLYKEYYENQVGYAQKAHEAKLALLDREKQYLNSVANAATSLLDKEISKVQDNAKEQQKPYEDQIKAAEKQIDAYEDQIKLFEKQIDAHNKQIDAYNKEIDLINDRKKPLQDELDALEDKAREENLILSLQEKQYNLKKAENQKDKLLYKDGQLIHTTDSTAIRDAKKEVEDAELEIQKNDIQKQIDALDDEIEKYNELIDAINDQIDVIDDQIEAVNDQIDAVNEYIDGLNDIVDQIGDAADAQVEALEKTKNKWQEMIDQQEEAQNMLLLTGEFGADAIRKILAGDDDDLLAQWKENYITTLSEIDSETQGYIGDMTEQLAGLYNVDLSPLQAQFNNVKESISGMTDSLGSAVNTIIGKGVESAMGGNQDSTQSTTSAPNVQGGTANSLADAFTQVGNTANDVIGNPGAEGDGTVIGEFGSMKTAVGDVTDAISTGDGSLENAILEETETALDAFDQHTDKINNEVIPAIQSATNEMNAFNETADRDIEKTITIKYETVGSPASNATTGAAHVEGTANVQGDWSVQTNEKHSLVGEVGRELIVRDGRFFTVGDNGAEMFPIKKGDIVFNHEQTEELLKNGHISGHGKAYADGTVGGGKVLLPDGQVLFRVPDDSPLFDLRRKAEAYMEKTGSKLEEVLKPVNAIQHHFEEIEKIIDNSTYNNIVNNNQPNTIINQEIHVTLPNITNSARAQQLLNDLQLIGTKKYQKFNSQH